MTYERILASIIVFLAALGVGAQVLVSVADVSGCTYPTHHVITAKDAP